VGARGKTSNRILMEEFTMRRFKNILLVTEGKRDTKAPLERAVTLAKENQASLTVVEVLLECPPEMQRAVTSVDLADLEDISTRERIKNLETLIAPITREGLKVTSKVLCGMAFLEIIREVLRNKHDLVMLSPEGKSRLNEILFGSTTMHLMRKCPCPVWVIKPTRRKQYTRILAAVDLLPFDAVMDDLNMKIMEIATSLAELEGSQLHVVHCWNQPLEKRMKGHSGLIKNEVKKLVLESRKQHKMWLNVFLEKFNLNKLNYQVHLLKGEAHKLIPEQAMKKRVELVVMGTVCRTGIAGLFIGNTAEKALHQLDCSVLAVKPEGFVTPVRLDDKK
jgi:nucleotide-binding universal stress UspA family protein